MTDCNSQNEELNAAEEHLASLQRMLAKQKAVTESLNAPASDKRWRPRVLKTVTGDEVSVDPVEWAKIAEEDAMRLGDDELTEIVEAGFRSQQRPIGRTGQMINYSLIAPTEENFAAVLELMGRKRIEGGKTELMRPFTQQAAGQAIIDTIRRYGGEEGADPAVIAAMLTKRFKGIDRLAIDVYTAAKGRWETGMAYADALEDMADLMELTGEVTPDARMQFANVAKWAHWYEQLDATVRRSVGQALQSLQKDT